MKYDNDLDWRQVKPRRRSRCKLFLARKARKFRDRQYDENRYEGTGENYRAGYARNNKKPR